MKFLVIGVTGKMRSGKDTIAEHLRDKYSFKILTYTDDILSPMLKVMGKSATRDNLIDLATDMRKSMSPDILTRMICKKIDVRFGRKGRWVISGVRLPEEVDYFRAEYGPNFKLIAADCSPKIRFERGKKRGDKGEKSISYKNFLETEKKPTEKPIEKSMKTADFVLNNNKSKKDLYSQIDKIMKKLI
jgi:dephospho-CoA kinase